MNYLEVYHIAGVKLGMTREEVEHVVGPPKEYLAEGDRWEYEPSLAEAFDDDGVNEPLEGHEGVLSYVIFDEESARVRAIGGWMVMRYDEVLVGPTEARELVDSALGPPCSKEAWVYNLEGGLHVEAEQAGADSPIFFVLV